jgi:hypothetical protein
MKHSILSVILISCLLIFLPGAGGVPALADACGGLHQADLQVDGVRLSLCLPFEMPPFLSPDADLRIQVASARDAASGRQVSLTAIPLGLRSGTEPFPLIAPGQEDHYRDLLRDFRVQQGGTLSPAPVVTLFGKAVAGLVSVVQLKTAGPELQTSRIWEWVVEAGARVWVLRIGEPLYSSMKSDPALVNGLTLSAQDVSVPSSSLAALREPVAVAPPLEPDNSPLLADLPFPTWWSGDCDTTHYASQTGKAAYPLGGSYRGLKACGPRPYADNGNDVLVYFSAGSWGVYEWECVELSLRYLYLAYGTPAYWGNGADIVRNYPGSRLVKVNNPTPGRAPQAGDVLSYNQYAPWGHTSVVSASSVDASGNGTITILEENGAANGTRTHSVTNWKVNDSQEIYGWLHDPRSDDFVAPTTTAQISTPPGQDGWYPSPVLVTLSAVDDPAGWGVKSTDYRIDGEPNYHVYTGVLSISSEGTHTVSFRSVDYANNWELEKSLTFKVDGTPPQGGPVTINQGAALTHATLVSLTAPVSDGLSGPSGVRIRNSGSAWGDWQPLKPAYGWLLPSQTGRTLGVEIQFRDLAGNLSPIYTGSIGLNIYPIRPYSAKYRLIRSTMGTSAMQANSSGYSLKGTAAQPGTVGFMQNDQHQLQSGYWSPYRHVILDKFIYVPLVSR